MPLAPGQEVVLVCGAGAAGSAAALAAARTGVPVCLVEASAGPGGTVANCLIHTLGGLYDSAGEFLHGGLVADLVHTLSQEGPATRRRLGRTWVLSVCPDLYRTVLQRWLATQPNLVLLTSANVSRLVVRDQLITEAHVVCNGRELRLRTAAVIDATGAAEVVRLLGPFLQGPGPRGQANAAGGLILRLRGLPPGALAFPRGVGVVQGLRSAAASGDLPPACAHAWLDSGTRTDEGYLKLLVPLPEDWRQQQEEIGRAALADLSAQARRDGEAVVNHLRRSAEFKEIWVEKIGALGVREGGRVRGEYCLSREDVLQGRKFADAACRCAWPIELWGEQGVSLEYLPPGSHYEVPLRALKVEGLSNLWAVGKCLSADVWAQASARVAGCCWAMGQAVGQVVAGEYCHGAQSL
jgi:FAD dependent oxidoreductase